MLQHIQSILCAEFQNTDDNITAGNTAVRRSRNAVLITQWQDVWVAR